MERDVAEEIYKKSLSIDPIIVCIDSYISNISDDEEKKKWVQRLGNVLRVINENLIVPVLKMYPHIDEGSR